MILSPEGGRYCGRQGCRSVSRQALLRCWRGPHPRRPLPRVGLRAAPGEGALFHGVFCGGALRAPPQNTPLYASPLLRRTPRRPPEEGTQEGLMTGARVRDAVKLNDARRQGCIQDASMRGLQPGILLCGSPALAQDGVWGLAPGRPVGGQAPTPKPLRKGLAPGSSEALSPVADRAPPLAAWLRIC